MSNRMVLLFPAVVALFGCTTPSPGAPGRTGPSTPVAESRSRSPAETAAMQAEAAGVISAQSSLRHLSVLAHDTMMGRDSERPEIWTAARRTLGSRSRKRSSMKAGSRTPIPSSVQRA